MPYWRLLQLVYGQFNSADYFRSMGQGLAVVHFEDGSVGKETEQFCFFVLQCTTELFVVFFLSINMELLVLFYFMRKIDGPSQMFCQHRPNLHEFLQQAKEVDCLEYFRVIGNFIRYRCVFT